MGQTYMSEEERLRYHVMNRGDSREPIFKDDKDHQCFMDTLGETCGKTHWQIHAWCLMPNHFHLVVETLPQMRLWGESTVIKKDPSGDRTLSLTST